MTDFDDDDASVARFRLLDLDDDAPRAPVTDITTRNGTLSRDTRFGLGTGDVIHETDKAAPGVEGAKAFRSRAGMTWQYVLETCERPRAARSCQPRGSWIVCSDTDQVVGGPVSSRYGLLQLDSLDIVDAIVGPTCRIDRGGVFRDGAIAWLQTRDDTFRFTGPQGETFESRALVSNSYDGSQAFRVDLSSVNVVCWNTYAMAMAGAQRSWTLRHTSGAQGRLDALKRAYSQGGAYYSALRDRLYSYASVRVSLDDAVRFARTLFVAPEVDEVSTRTQNLMDRWIAGYLDAPAAMPGTAYGLLQGVTHWASHEHGRNPGDEYSVQLGSAQGWAEEASARLEQTVSVLRG